MLADPGLINDNQWPHNIELLRQAQQSNCMVALATMSHRAQAQHILDVLNLNGAFDFVATRDDVEKGNPDPEIYHLVAAELALSLEDCLVIEDSPSGVAAALAAGMQVVAVATPFTQQRLHQANILPEALIVDRPNQLAGVVYQIINQAST